MLNNTDTVDLPCLAVSGNGTVLSAEAVTSPRSSSGASAHASGVCFHCGTRCSGVPWVKTEKVFCCQGCLTVYELLTENGLGDFYSLEQGAGIKRTAQTGIEYYRFVDALPVRERLVDFSNERITRITLLLPAIHCVACVWLLENLFRLNSAIGQSQVNFPRKEVAISFDPARAKLSEVLGLLASLGYEPELKLSDLENRPSRQVRRIWLQLGIAGFAFGNTMLFSIASYLGLDSASGPRFRSLVGVISLILSVPVVFYSASDYWRSAWTSLKQRLLNIDVPIAAGILALFGQSVFEVATGRGEGYFDSLAGLLFFLLCGRLFQQKTFDRLAFDRDYRSFFPLSVSRENNGVEERLSLSQLQVGDRLVVRNGELIPADSKLVEGSAVIDYSFVTGEAEPVEKSVGEHLYAGGRQVGAAIRVQMTKAVSQGYLTSLWNQDAFTKRNSDSLNVITNQYSQRFTKLVLAVAVGSALFWAWANPAISIKAFTSVLIVACPCALALAAPFALGTAQRILAKRNIFLKNTAVLERMATADSIVFDKTGTLTAAVADVRFHGNPLTEIEWQAIASLAAHSTHPYAARIASLARSPEAAMPVRSFRETPGCGIEGIVDGREIWLGSAAWFKSRGAVSPDEAKADTHSIGSPDIKLNRGSVVQVAVDRTVRGWFEVTSSVRPSMDQLLSDLGSRFKLALLSGDHEKDRSRFEQLFGTQAHLQFNQSPADKLQFIQKLQEGGRRVIMVGDGLNDAGALRQSDVGVAVVENISSFSPASDVILAADRLEDFDNVLRFSKRTVVVVRASFLISTIYNIVGVSIAARGLLSPVVCAILMPLSSATVVLFACGAAVWAGRHLQATNALSRHSQGSFNPVSVAESKEEAV